MSWSLFCGCDVVETVLYTLEIFLAILRYIHSFEKKTQNGNNKIGSNKLSRWNQLFSHSVCISSNTTVHLCLWEERLNGNKYIGSNKFGRWLLDEWYTTSTVLVYGHWLTLCLWYCVVVRTWSKSVHLKKHFLAYDYFAAGNL